MGCDVEANEQDDVVVHTFKAPCGRWLAVEVQEDQQARNTMGADHVGSTVWAAGLLLARHLEQRYANERMPLPSVALELGSGTGLVGLVLCALGVEHVMCTDLPCRIPLLAKNLSRASALRQFARASEELGEELGVRPASAALDWRSSREELQR